MQSFGRSNLIYLKANQFIAQNIFHRAVEVANFDMKKNDFTVKSISSFVGHF